MIKHCFLMREGGIWVKQSKAKQSNGFISVIQTLLCQKQWLRGGMLTLNVVVQTHDAECSGCPDLAVVLENTKKLCKLVLVDHKLKLHEIAEELGIPESSIFTILHEQLSMRKLCSKWVLHLLTVDQEQRIHNSEHCLQHNKKEFLCKCDMDPLLHSRIKLAVGWVNSNNWKLSKVTRHKHQQARFWPPYFEMCKVFCLSITLRNKEPSIANII